MPYWVLLAFGANCRYFTVHQQSGHFMATRRIFHLHLLSDATGETLNAVARAACAQYEDVRPVEHIYALVRGPKQLDRAIGEIEAAPGIVMFTMVNADLRDKLVRKCAELEIPCISVLDPVIGALGSYLGRKISNKPGGQHAMNAEYFDRIEALNYTMAHDDGQETADINDADIVLVGVSRTSKTPTCIYLANRGIKAANIPLVPNVPLPDSLMVATNPLIVGLIANPERLVQIRKNRLLSLNEKQETEYVDKKLVTDEVAQARRLYNKHGWATIDVTRRSIEETSAAVLNLYSRHRQEMMPSLADD
ncbi:MAG: regulator of PEP synthase PpsR (kinase-PPPase family) [Parvibaculaceae bacterium]|jgi:regulator of PEP synthase PpsR (kinase-PPPase family)